MYKVWFNNQGVAFIFVFRLLRSGNFPSFRNFRFFPVAEIFVAVLSNENQSVSMKISGWAENL